LLTWKKKKDDKGGERVVRRRASDSTTWKRKESKEDVVSQVKSLAELKGKRKKIEIEEDEARKRGKTNGGHMGMAVAGSQPHRPQ
jgi:hypothetical protein